MATKAEDLRRGTPPFDPAKKLPDLGNAPITGERFASRDWMEREWAMLWRRVWNMGCRLTDIPEPGDLYRHDFGKESFIFVRGADGEVRGFYNVCQHRGNQLVLGAQGCHHAQAFHCAYHGWQWHLDGTLAHVPDADTFPQFAGGIPYDELGLEPVQVDVWGGWIWFRMEPGGPSLKDYLGDIPEHLDPYEIDRWSIVDMKTYEWPCNWKAACDAFNETYHFGTLHAQTMAWANGTADVELLGIHSRMINKYLTVDPRYPDQENLNEGLKHFMRSIYRLDPDVYQGRPQDVRLELQRRKRAMEDDTYLPYRNLNDDQLSDTFHYTIFPNVSWNLTAESIIGFRYRPHATDPGRCFYDLIIMRCANPEKPAPDYDHRYFGIDELPARFVDSLDIDADPVVITPLDQDAGVLPYVQQGLSSDGFRGMVLSDQEARVRLFHTVLDEYLEGKR